MQIVANGSHALQDLRTSGTGRALPPLPIMSAARGDDGGLAAAA